MKDSNVHTAGGSEATLPRPTPTHEGARLASWGPAGHLFPPLLGNARQPRNPRSRRLASLPGGRALGSAPLPTCHTSPHHSPHSTSPQPLPFKALESPEQGRTQPGGQEQGALPAARLHKAGSAVAAEARPLPRAGRARAPAPTLRPPPQPPERHSRSGLR